MVIDADKLNIIKARYCKSTADLISCGIPKGTLCRALTGKNIRPETAGKIARALGCDPLEIIEEVVK